MFTTVWILFVLQGKVLTDKNHFEMLSKLMSLLIKRNFVFIGMCQWQQTHNYLGFPKGESKVKNALRYFYFFCFCVQSQIAVWALKRMRACLIRGQGIDLQGFNQMQYCMQSLGSFHCIPPRASFVKLAHWYAMALLAVRWIIFTAFYAFCSVFCFVLFSSPPR